LEGCAVAGDVKGSSLGSSPPKCCPEGPGEPPAATEEEPRSKCTWFPAFDV